MDTKQNPERKIWRILFQIGRFHSGTGLFVVAAPRHSRNIFLLLSFQQSRLSWAGFPSLAIDCREETSYFAQKIPARISQWSQPAATERRLYGVETLFVLSFRQSCAPVNVVIACLPQLLFVAAHKGVNINSRPTLVTINIPVYSYKSRKLEMLGFKVGDFLVFRWIILRIKIKIMNYIFGTLTWIILINCPFIKIFCDSSKSKFYDLVLLSKQSLQKRVKYGYKGKRSEVFLTHKK